MLSAKENFIETVRGGVPDRFVNQYEALRLLPHAYALHGRRPAPGGKAIKNEWGVTMQWPAGHPGAFPVHDAEAIVVKDIEEWKSYVKAPSLKFGADDWAQLRGIYAEAEERQCIKATFIAPGLFEHTHYLCSMSEALMNYITNPDEMHELVKYLTDWELELAEGVCANLKPDAVFHHDDWGSETSTFLSPAMFEDFFTEPYKKIYGYYHDHGVKYVIHHSDSYAASLVPAMIEMGVDVWQGVMASNDVPALAKKYGGRITFMGGIDNKLVDHEGWTAQECRAIVKDLCDGLDPRGFIPCITQGAPGSCVVGAYEALSDAIDEYNAQRFGVCSAREDK